LALFHHDPSHTDEAIDRMLDEAQRRAAASSPGLEVEAAREGATVVLGS